MAWRASNITIVGCWLLAVGCWLLAVGCWPLTVGRGSSLHGQQPTVNRQHSWQVCRIDLLSADPYTPAILSSGSKVPVQSSNPPNQEAPACRSKKSKKSG